MVGAHLHSLSYKVSAAGSLALFATYAGQVQVFIWHLLQVNHPVTSNLSIRRCTYYIMWRLQNHWLCMQYILQSEWTRVYDAAVVRHSSGSPLPFLLDYLISG
jgi:hypothetical protein